MRSEVQVLPDPPPNGQRQACHAALADMSADYDSGAIAQLGERLICIQEVVGSIPSGSTITLRLDSHESPKQKAT